jgi:hypothetical protein
MTILRQGGLSMNVSLTQAIEIHAKAAAGSFSGITFSLLCCFRAQSIDMFGNTDAQRRPRQQSLCDSGNGMLGFRLIETFGSGKASAATGRAGRNARSSQEAFPDNLGRELGNGEFFYFFRRNPLKSPDST